MSTRSRIGMYIGNNTTISVYEHYDGYLQGVGSILKRYYSDENKIKKLIEQGDISSLDRFIGQKHDFSKHPDGWCTFYKRDRGEDGVDAVEMSLDDLAKAEEYNYLWDGKKWLYSKGYICDGWHVLTDKECGITQKDKEQAKKEITEQKNKEFNIMMYDALHNDIYFH